MVEGVCFNCGELKNIHRKKLCHSCYMIELKGEICPECGERKIICSDGMCSDCKKQIRKNKACSICGRNDVHIRLNGLCLNCHRKKISSINCSDCGEYKKEYSKGRCYSCHNVYVKSKTECMYCGKIGVVSHELCEECFGYYMNAVHEKNMDKMINAFIGD